MPALRTASALFCLILIASPALAEEPTSAVGPLMKLFESGRLPAQRQPAVVEMICQRGNANDLRVVLDRILQADGFVPELRIQALDWLADAAETRKVVPAGDLSGLAALVIGDRATGQPQLQRRAIRLAAEWKVAAVAPALQKLATSTEVTPALQRSAIDGLITIGDPGSHQTLKELATAGHPLPVRMQATAGIVSFDASAAATAAAAVLHDATAKDALGPLLDAFFQHKEGVDGLAAAIKAHPPTADVAKVALRYMYSVGRSDAALSNVLGNIAGISADPTPPTPEEVARIVDEVIAKGNPARGEAIFRRKDLSCMKCHSVSRAGGQVGPDLSPVGVSSPVDYVVNSILNPNLAVKEQYVTKVFELTSGKVLTGVVIDRDDVRVNIRDVTGTTVTIPVADIEEEVEGRSLMPQGLTKFLTHEELVDLAKFVSELGKPGPYVLNPGRTIQRWRLMNEAPEELTSSVPHLEHVRELILGSDSTHWTPVYSQVAGVLPLSELRENGEPFVLILKGEVQVRTAGAVHFHLDCTERTQVWVDAQPFDDAKDWSATFDPGVHAVILRIELSDRPDPTLKLEVSTPNDSSAKFELVGGY
ncbi:hypothetical protein GC163_05915 [bacterium]|nr:hypothetical protein [bacterium]